MDEITAIRRMKAGDFGGLESLMARFQVKAVRAAFLITRDSPGGGCRSGCFPAHFSTRGPFR